MKTKITLGSISILFAILLSGYGDVIANSGGSPGGRSSSAGDSGNTCGQAGCHGGGATLTAGIITTTIPMAGYTPGMTYTVNVAGTSGSGTKFGFELAAEDAANATAGTLVPASPVGVRERILSNGHATHTSGGNTGTAGNYGWQLDWTAPAAGTGTVTFSTAVLVANNNGNNSGDNTLRFSTTASEATTTAVSELKAENTKLYPNPMENNLNIFTENSSVNRLIMFNAEGKIVLDAQINSVDQIDVSHLVKGIYFATISNGQTSVTKKMIKL